MDTEVIEPELRPVAELLRRTLDTRAGDVAIPPRLERVVQPRRQRPWAALAACAVIVVGATTALTFRAIAPDDRDRAVGSATTTAAEEVATSENIQWYLPDHIPDGYVLTDLVASPSAPMFELNETPSECPGDCPHTVQMTLTPEGRGVAMLVIVGPNDPSFRGETPDDIETIDGYDYAIYLGDTTYSVDSVQGDVFLRVINASDPGTALAMATSIRPVSVEEAQQAASAIDERLQSYPQVAAATLGDGTTVAVRRADGVDDVAVALCLEGGAPTCRQPPADADPGAPAHVAATFDTGGSWRIVAWHETEGQLAFVGHLGDGRAEESLPTELVPAHEGEGWFASTRLPGGDDDTIVSINVGTGTDLSYVVPGGGITPT